MTAASPGGVPPASQPPADANTHGQGPSEPKRSSGLFHPPSADTGVPCPSCGGWGDHGLDDEGRSLVCYTCYGMGIREVGL